MPNEDLDGRAVDGDPVGAVGLGALHLDAIVTIDNATGVHDPSGLKITSSMTAWSSPSVAGTAGWPAISGVARVPDQGGCSIRTGSGVENVGGRVD